VLLVENVILCETPVCVYASKKHSLANVSVASPTLEAFAAEDVGLAGDNIALPQIRDLLAYFDDLAGKLVSHDHWRFDLSLIDSCQS